MKTLLKAPDIEYLLSQQEKLDNDIKSKFNINNAKWNLMMIEEHELALRVELHEFINACFKSWKYWKTKDMNMDDVLDEAIDVIHFVMLDLNKRNVDGRDLAVKTAHHLEGFQLFTNDAEVKNHMHFMSVAQLSSREILTGVLQILDYYNFTVIDIMDQYMKKNAENFKRMQENY